MKCSIPEISWHNRDPVLSVDFQPRSVSREPQRIATGGTDTHVLIWYITHTDSGTISLEVASDLARHQKAVNVVRWSPCGKFLASGDDESIIFVWTQKTDKDPPALFDVNDDQDRETWVIHKTLRGHLEDIYDISWNSASTHLVSGSVDNTVVLWDLAKGKSTAIFADHKGFVQGVSWDPSNQYIASISSDRVFRVFEITSKKVISRSSKAILPVPESHPLYNQSVRLYYDDTLQSYFRRLQFSPDGLLIAVPSGYIEPDQSRQIQPMHAVYIYTRYSLKVPACVLPCGSSPALAVRWSPVQYSLRAAGPHPPALPLSPPRRMLLAVATKGAVILYDTQQKTPLAVVSNIHYTRLTDLTWSSDGKLIVVSSTDGFCSVITFSDNELGEIYTPVIQPAQETDNPTGQKFKVPTEKNNRTEVETTVTKNKTKTPKSKEPKVTMASVAPEMIDETAMQPWSDDSNTEIKNKNSSMAMDENTEDIKLVYDESESAPIKSEEKKLSPVQNKTTVTSNECSGAPAPKTPRRVNFVTLSSPKNRKMC